ncbi:MAG: ChaN family lipoprotein [Hyphomicrobiaceae bacterium]
MACRTTRRLLFGLATAAMTLVAATTRAETVSDVCRLSPHQTNGPASSAPDICATIDVAAANGTPRIVDVARAVDELANAADQSDFVLLGEIHDNPSHHRIRSQILLAMAALRAKAKRGPPALVLEHIRADQALAVAGFRAVDRVSRRATAEFFSAVDWKRSGWPDEGMFRPLIDAALDAEWPILHGNLAREAVRSVAKRGVSAVDPEEGQRLGLETHLPDAAQSGLLDELVASHCGLMPRTSLATMADAQRYRDAYMASRLVDAANTHHGAVLLAGNGHVRSDRGVPWHLNRLAPGKRTLVVIFAQAASDHADALAYVERGPNGSPLADYVVVTPRVERPDPCLAMKRRLSTPPKPDVRPGAPKKH